MPPLSAASRDARLTAIGASEVAMLLDLSPYGGPHALWQRKVEGQTGSDFESLSQRLGQLLEGPTRILTAEREGVRIRENGETRRHRTLPLVATPDGFVDRPSALYEGKARAFGRDEWGEPGDPDGVPPAVRAQAAAQRIVWRRQRSLVGVLIGGSDPRAYWIDRDRELEEAIEDAVAEFWPYVERGEPPPVDGSEGAGAWLRRRFRPDPGNEVVATPEQTFLVEELRLAAGELQSAEDRFELARQRIQEVMTAAGAERLLAPGASISWKRPKPTEKTAWELVARAYRQALLEVAAHDPWIAFQVVPHVEDREFIEDLAAIESLYTATAQGEPRFLHPFTRSRTAQRGAA